MTNGRLPRLLTKSMAEVARLSPTSLSATIKNTPPSTATITMPNGGEQIAAQDWVEVFGETESLGVFVARSCTKTPGGDMRVQLEHGIVTLEKNLTPTGTKLTGSIRSIARRLLAYQTEAVWTLGSAPTTGSYTLETSHENLLEALLSTLKLVDGYGLTFDQSALPWRVNIVELGTVPVCECRLRRNVVGVSITEDDSDLCTRVVSPALNNGKTDGHMDADTIDRWGVIEKPLDIADDTKKSDAQAYAQEYLEAHKNIAVSIEVDALSLAQMTGEPLDRFRVGEICRVALPDYGMTQEVRIVSMRFDSLLDTPQRARLTLSTPPKDASRNLATIKKQTNSVSAETTRQGARIRSQGAAINTKVPIDEIIEYINADGGTVKIKAAKIDLGNYATVGTLKATIIETLQGYTGRFQTGSLYVGGTANVESLQIKGAGVWINNRTFVTGVALPTPHFTTLNYKNHSGVNTSTLVCNGFTETGSVTRASNATYLCIG